MNLTNQILCGYQGWFAHPADGSPLQRWSHWFAQNSSTAIDFPSANHLTVEMYPLMDEYDDDDLFESNIPMQRHVSGKARFYSAARPGVVKKHFEWMRIYGISGVFHMRFLLNHDKQGMREFRTTVLRNVRDAAEENGRVFAVSYNLSGATLTDDVLDLLKEDWIRLVDEERITSSSQYLRHTGKLSCELPVLRIYGIGFKTVNVQDTARLAALIHWFQYSGGKYRVFLIGGVPSNWRERIKDSRGEIEWKHIYESLDGIHPWHVGRWSSIDGFQRYYSKRIAKDATLCEQLGIVYMPSMWPGFSWHNLKNEPINSIPRLGGKLMWAQACRYVADKNIRTIWMAQFDEVDEGTAIFKVAKDQSEVPDEGEWLTLDVDGEYLPSDWYLRLCGVAQRMLSGEIELTDTIPISPYGFCGNNDHCDL